MTIELRTMNREAILRRFEQWLDETLSAEDPPGGVDADLLRLVDGSDLDSSTVDAPPGDAYTLAAALTALTHEIKLEGRAFKELQNALGSHVTAAANEIRAAYRERERDVTREAERRSRRDTLSALIDLRDRLGRGLESVRAAASTTPQRSWLPRIFARRQLDPLAAQLAALTKGYELGLARLDQVLVELNVHEIQCDGQPFDPRTMNAIDREESSAVAEGTVVEVYRRGYEWSGEVFRTAEVKVSCAPAAGQPLMRLSKDDE